MSSITTRLVARFDRWLDRVVATDERFICAACDDRFGSRSLGVEHVQRCHPEYQGVVVFEGAPVEAARPARAPRPVFAPQAVPVAVPAGR